MSVASNVGADLSAANRYARAPSRRAEGFSTESYLRAISFGESGPAEAAWARSMAERIDPKGARNDAVHDAFAAVGWRGSISGTAKELERWLSRYVLEVWPLDQERGGPGDCCGALRLQLWRIAKLNRGAALGWRQILRVLEQ